MNSEKVTVAFVLMFCMLGWFAAYSVTMLVVGISSVGLSSKDFHIVVRSIGLETSINGVNLVEVTFGFNQNMTCQFTGCNVYDPFGQLCASMLAPSPQTFHSDDNMTLGVPQSMILFASVGNYTMELDFPPYYMLFSVNFNVSSPNQSSTGIQA